MSGHARREPLPPGTKVSRDVVRRVWGFARDFRWQIAAYLLLLVVALLDLPVMLWLVSAVFNVDWSDPGGVPRVISIVVSMRSVRRWGRCYGQPARRATTIKAWQG